MNGTDLPNGEKTPKRLHTSPGQANTNGGRIRLKSRKKSREFTTAGAPVQDSDVTLKCVTRGISRQTDGALNGVCVDTTSSQSGYSACGTFSSTLLTNCAATGQRIPALEENVPSVESGPLMHSLAAAITEYAEQQGRECMSVQEIEETEESNAGPEITDEKWKRLIQRAMPPRARFVEALTWSQLERLKPLLRECRNTNWWTSNLDVCGPSENRNTFTLRDRVFR